LLSFRLSDLEPGGFCICSANMITRVPHRRGTDTEIRCQIRGFDVVATTLRQESYRNTGIPRPPDVAVATAAAQAMRQFGPWGLDLL
jgi:hypothetical protein